MAESNPSESTVTNVRVNMHERCSALNMFANFNNPIACRYDDVNRCLSAHYHHIAATQEHEHRKDLMNECYFLFPEHPRHLIDRAINSLPLYINAEYVILHALLSDTNQYYCPEVTVTVQEDEPVNDFIENFHFIHTDREHENKTGNVVDLINGDTEESVESQEGAVVPPNPIRIRRVHTSQGLEEFKILPNPTDNAYTPMLLQPRQNVIDITQDVMLPKRKCTHPDNVPTLQFNKIIKLEPREKLSIVASTSASSVYNKPEIPPVPMPSTSSSTVVIDTENEMGDCEVVVLSEHTQKLVNHLAEIFPDAQLDYLKSICKNYHLNSQNAEYFTEKLLTTDYPRKEREVESFDFDAQLEIMMTVLPDADHEYLTTELAKLTTKAQFSEFINNAVDKRDYPKTQDMERKRQLNAQVRQYTTDFDAFQFLSMIPNPETYFTDNFKAGIIVPFTSAYFYMLAFLRNHFNRTGIRRINHVINNADTFLNAVKMIASSTEGRLASKRKTTPLSVSTDIPLLQLIAYVQYKHEIEKAQSDIKIMAEKRRRTAIDNKEVNTCCCCYDEEVLQEDTYICPNNHMACNDCIKKSAEINFGENHLQFACLAGCEARYSLEVLQSALSPKMFSKIAQRIQLEEIKSAGMEDLEICPFCDFAAIPVPTDKIFKCYNPECMKESCRECKQPSHIPLRCNELEQDAEVKTRTYIEDKMTEALMRKCWKCGLKFIKADGCNKITCQCLAMMCYICNKPVQDYNHFNGQGANHPGRCPLYSNTTLMHEMDAIKGGKQAKEALGVTQMKVDPLADADERIKKAKINKNPGGPHF